MSRMPGDSMSRDCVTPSNDWDCNPRSNGDKYLSGLLAVSVLCGDIVRVLRPLDPEVTMAMRTASSASEGCGSPRSSSGETRRPLETACAVRQVKQDTILTRSLLSPTVGAMVGLGVMALRRFDVGQEMSYRRVPLKDITVGAGSSACSCCAPTVQDIGMRARTTARGLKAINARGDRERQKWACCRSC